MIAEMAAGAGHELNNPLSVISGRAQMLLRDGALNPETEKSLEAICAKAHECSRIVSDLMDFARPPAPRLEVVDLAGLIAELRHAWLDESGLGPSQVSVEFEAARTLVRADREQLRSVLTELLRNATEAIGDTNGMIQFSWREATLSRAGAGRGVEIAIRDTGRGMTPAVLQRVFDPFFSHRKAGRGRGLGLARAHRVIDAHEGRIWLESRPGEGTTAFIVLPLAGG
jgi:two-component system NtrC family sensor kinase